MKQLANIIAKQEKEDFMYAVQMLLVWAESWRLEKPTCPLLILFESGVNADAFSTNKKTGRTDGYSYTCLCQLANRSSATNARTNRNQVILVRQFLEVGGANVNACNEQGISFPLFNACASNTCTNPELIRLLLEHGADPNQQNINGVTALMNTVSDKKVKYDVFLLTCFSN